MKATDCVGKRFGMLVLQRLDEKEPHESRAGIVLCDCGRSKRCRVSSLVAGRIKSCGCTRRNIGATSSVALQRAHEREHRSWASMVRRCYYVENDNYSYYGGRGVTVCERWLSFENFLTDMGTRPADTSLDRIDPDGNYEPSNCRWLEVRQQHVNKRNTVYLTVGDVSLPMREWAERTGIAYDTIKRRLQHGWTHTDAVTLPVCAGNKFSAKRLSMKGMAP